MNNTNRLSLTETLTALYDALNVHAYATPVYMHVTMGAAGSSFNIRFASQDRKAANLAKRRALTFLRARGDDGRQLCQPAPRMVSLLPNREDPMTYEPTALVLA